VLLTKVVARAAPFHSTTDDAAKLLPLTVSVKAGAPALALLGASELSVGAGFAVAKRSLRSVALAASRRNGFLGGPTLKIVCIVRSVELCV